MMLSVPTMATLVIFFLSNSRTLAFSLVVNLIAVLLFHLRRICQKGRLCQSCCVYARVDTTNQDFDSDGIVKDATLGMSS